MQEESGGAGQAECRRSFASSLQEGNAAPTSRSFCKIKKRAKVSENLQGTKG
jgi:hypothetical protein